ncbi:hypothetical protein NDU88_008510 [Pleurodeles waltl]|uniref:Uncharacterized protein n=1 Tax=Pleurodeles waltl TaxID=8319 RepID=A0AAV7RUY1_PLEWA|nr:hypothetical protein NDU88_008510 [Pleurodeles waltl]
MTRLCVPGMPSPLGASLQLRVHMHVGSLGADQSRNGSRRRQRRMKESVRPSPRPRHLLDIAAARCSLPRWPSYFVARPRPTSTSLSPSTTLHVALILVLLSTALCVVLALMCLSPVIAFSPLCFSLFNVALSF